MSIAVAPPRVHRRPVGARPRASRALVLVMVLLVVGLATGAFALGRSAAGHPPPADSIANVGGIPVGIEHTPAGAVAAADNYVMVEQASVEQDPARETRLIDTVDAPSYRPGDLQSAAAVRAANPTGMAFAARGGHDLPLIGASRLDYYSGDVAEVTIWHAGIFWGAGQPRTPSQSWEMDQTSLRWGGRQWFVTSDGTMSAAGPAPASTPQSSPANSTSQAFSSDLAGYTTPSYGAAG